MSLTSCKNGMLHWISSSRCPMSNLPFVCSVLEPDELSEFLNGDLRHQASPIEAIVLGKSNRHATDHHLFGRNRKQLPEQCVIFCTRLLCTGLTAPPSAPHHAFREEQAGVAPAALLQPPIDRHNQADRRAEEAVILRGLPCPSDHV